ncbi:DUF4232 domain-containing protein [Streptomyces sp. NPDC052236]|uniref:DUF4232 domain-containing protein n=1 Tax=Streptomyces sp. NPDC052236 TaxID=3365686 RepID=UPI0037CE0FF8
MRTSTRRALPAVLVSALFLTACGSQTADSPGGGGRNPSAVSDSPSLPGDPADLEKDGVRITGMSPSLDFEVTNPETEPFTYTITFDVLPGSGGVMANMDEIVPSVGAGQTVKRTLSMDSMRPHDTGRMRISQVRRVPSDEVPVNSGPCPSSGVRVTADDGDAAMGLRVVGLHLVNCGTRGYNLNGYPLIGLLDEERESVSGIEILNGGGGISTGTGTEEAPQPLTLEPGEAASATLVWRNTTGAGTAVNAPYVRVRAKSGAQPVIVTPELDLGTTGKLGVGPWKKDPAR